MNRGYRLSSAVALANYYSDVRNMAEFAEYRSSGIGAERARQRGAGQRMLNNPYAGGPTPAVDADVKSLVLDPRSRYGAASAAEVAANAAAQRAALNDPFRGVRRGAGRAASRAGYAVGQGAAQAGRVIGGAAEAAGYLARRNPLAAGALGLAAAGGLGYGAYRATRPEDEQY